jgi:hypothetical protein
MRMNPVSVSFKRRAFLDDRRGRIVLWPIVEGLGVRRKFVGTARRMLRTQASDIYQGGENEPPQLTETWRQPASPSTTISKKTTITASCV